MSCTKKVIIFSFIVVTALCFSALTGHADSNWAQAAGVWQWSFPRDHGSHPAFRTEWWYFTGNLVDDQGLRYGYQLTFFRQGLRTEQPEPGNLWSVRDVFFAHFTLTDGARHRFHMADCISRSGPGLAGARTDGMDVWILDWSAVMNDSTVSLIAAHAGMELQLILRPRKPLVFHGQNGLSAKGKQVGQASYYTSFTDVETRGRLRVPGRSSGITVTGVSWFDHEFGSNQLAPDQQGWDWFSIHVSDGRDLMVYLLRKTDESIEKASSGTLIEADGTWRHLGRSDIAIGVLETWESPHSGSKYPSKWRVQIPSAALNITIAPLVADQELNTAESINLTYWEGAVAGEGTSGTEKVSCEGYVELTGYGERLGGVF